MARVQLVPESQMEDLLASIKRAIAAEGGAANARSRGTPGSETPVFGGSMREMRVRPVEPTEHDLERARAGDILSLRSKISGQLARFGEERREPPAERDAGRRANGFAGLLGGEGKALEGSAEKPVAPSAEPDSLPRPNVDRTVPAEPEIRHAYGREAILHEKVALQETDHWLPSSVAMPSGHRPIGDQDSIRSHSGLLSADAATATSAAFGRLADTLMARAIGERPIEEVTRELLRGMLKQWLDDHLPAIVERLVREEIEKVARRGSR